VWPVIAVLVDVYWILPVIGALPFPRSQVTLPLKELLSCLTLLT
jgi:hypothetical protein